MNKTRLPSSWFNPFHRLRQALSKGLDAWERHQKLWWWFVAIVTMVWLAYDVGRVVTRSELIRVGGEIRGVLTIEEAITKADETQGGRIIITGINTARYIDGAGLTWEIPDFGRYVDRSVMERLREERVSFDGVVNIELTPVKVSPQDILISTLSDVLIKMIFISIYVFIIYLVLKHLGGNKKNKFNTMGKNGHASKVKIKDVAGLHGPKQEVLEIVEYLRDPSKYTKVGARPPSGVLMYGPPGNGKTLIAKAIAGEANAHFMEQSASSFIEIYAGEGGRAVRKLFEEARKHLPCVIFIDEIDAIGTSRSSASHSEQVQTINALLTEMDGFTTNEGLVIIAATNRLEVLDEALVRPGRFDRKVFIPMPSKRDRLEILQAHARKLPAVDVDFEHWAEQTRNFSGASLAGLVNEAAIEAARQGKAVVSDVEFSDARDRILMGAMDDRLKLSPHEKHIVAVHELGHALMRLHVGGKVEKISIRPRGQALGVTMSSFQEEETFLKTEQEIHNELQVLMGGRAAEEVVFGRVTGGSADDIARASSIARFAVKSFGFGEMGPYVQEGPHAFQEVDQKAKEWVSRAYEETKATLLPQKERLEHLSTELMDQDEVSGLWLESRLTRL